MHPNYLLAQKLIQKANKKGYNREYTDYAAEYWWATRQYLTPEFMKTLFPDSWMSRLVTLVLLEQEEQAKELALYI